MPYHNTDHRPGEIDRRILYVLMSDARDTSANTLAAEAGVSGATIRDRIRKPEDSGVICGSTMQVDFKLAGGKLMNLHLYDVPVTERETPAHEAWVTPGIVNIRTLMTGRHNLHVLAVSEDTGDLRRVARLFTDIGTHIEDEDLLEEEPFAPYGSFDLNDGGHASEANDFINLIGDASVVKVPVQSDAPIASLTLENASERGTLDDETLVIAIEWGNRELIPYGDTIIESDDIMTALFRAGGDADTGTLPVFHGPQTGSSPG